MDIKSIRKTSFKINFAALICLLVAVVFSLILKKSGYEEYTTNAKSFFIVSAFLSSICAVFLPYVLTCGMHNAKNNHFNKIDFIEAVKWIIFGLSFILIANSINGFLANILNQMNIEDPINKTPAINSVWDAILVFLSISIFPAIFEELTFRWIILDVLRKNGNAFAIIISSILFGLSHGNWYQFLFATLVGFVLSYIMIKTENIIIPMTIHACNNSIATISIFAKEFDFFREATLILAVSFFVIIIIGLMIALKKKKTEDFTLKKLQGILKGQNKKVYFSYIFPWFIPVVVIYLSLSFKNF